MTSSFDFESLDEFVSVRDYRPFLKWIGGKRQLLPTMLPIIDRIGSFDAYHEPFVGGGALYFALYGAGKIRHMASLSDINPRLVETYRAVADNVDRVIELLEQHAELHSEGYFYRVRANVPDDPVERAARIIFLNKTCFNGLFRENRKGLFNAPFGFYKNPTICDKTTLRAASKALKRAALSCQSFSTIIDKAQPGDFVYFDPPYVPVSKTSFTSYSKDGFTIQDQTELASVFAELAAHGVSVMLSNSDTPEVRALYSKFKIQTVMALRAVNCKGTSRGRVAEVLVTNF